MLKRLEGHITIVLWQTNLDYAVIGSALMLILGRSAQVYTSLQQQRAEMTTQIAMMLYGKARDSQEGALFSVLDEMAAQYYKELIFTYSMLLTQKGHFSAEGFDEKCEQFLEDNFNLKIDFAIEDSLHRLQREGLIIFDENDGLPVAKDLDSAMVGKVAALPAKSTTLEPAWSFFKPMIDGNWSSSALQDQNSKRICLNLFSIFDIIQMVFLTHSIG